MSVLMVSESVYLGEWLGLPDFEDFDGVRDRRCECTANESSGDFDTQTFFVFGGFLGDGDGLLR